MDSLFGTAGGSNPGHFDLKSDTNHYYTAKLPNVVLVPI